jgi:hypothetical protein
MKLRHFALVLVATMFQAGCQKTFTGTFDWSGTAHTISITGTLANAEGAATIQSVRLSLDGQEIRTISLSQTTSQIAITGSRLGERGRHTLAIAVVEQTISPTNYSLSGVRVSLVDAGLGGGTTLAMTTLSDRSERLASGGQISYQFDL